MGIPTETLQRESIQIWLNMKQPTDRFIFDAITTSPLGSISAAKLAKHILLEWAQQHCDHLDMANYRTDQPVERKKRAPRQPKAAAPAQVQPQVRPQAPAPAHTAPVAAPPVPVVAEPVAEPAVIKPVPQPISEPKHEQIEPQNTVQNAAQNTSNFDQKPASESEIQNDVLQSILKHNSNPENMQELASKITRHSH